MEEVLQHPKRSGHRRGVRPQLYPPGLSLARSLGLSLDPKRTKKVIKDIKDITTMGIEHDQLDFLESVYYAGGDLSKASPPSDRISDISAVTSRLTPNQHLAQSAVNCAINRQRAPAEALALFKFMLEYGHQCTAAGGYADESFCPSPHSEIWAGAVGFLHWWAINHNRPVLLAAIREYWSYHLGGMEPFWTPQGLRIPCSRALGKGETDIRPQWVIDSQIYAMASGRGAGGLLKPGKWPWGMIKKELSAELKNCYRTRTIPKLHNPRQLWKEKEAEGDNPGGFVSAFLADEPMNDRLSWIKVSEQGDITASSRTLADLPTNLLEPVIIT
jgi:hypothetical protein